MSNSGNRTKPGDSLFGAQLDEAAPSDLWNEDGDILWLRRDLAATASKARYIAYSGRGLPVGQRECGVSLTEIRVRALFLRPGEEDEVGWAGNGADTWWRCEREHPKAVAYWELRFG